MLLFGLIALLHGPVAYVWGMDCMLETLKCSRYRAPLDPRKNLPDTPAELDNMCKQQELFFNCLKKVRKQDPQSDEFPSPLLTAQLLTEELCSEGSSWRKRFLDVAPCINMQQTDFCTSPDFLAAVTNDRTESSCHGRQKSRDCVSAILVMNCDLEAGNVFHYLLKMTSDVEESCADSEIVSLCEPKDNETKKKLSDMYSGLLRKIGDIPEQEDESNQMSVNLKSGKLVEKSVSESIKDALDDIEQDFDSKNTLESDGVDLQKLDSKPLTDEIKETLYTLEEQFKLVTTLGTDEPDNFETTTQEVKSHHEDANPETKGYKVNSSVYTYENGRVNAYWKQPGFIPIDTLDCHYDFGVFHCILRRRSEDPECIEYPDAPVLERIEPESIDPEFGITLFNTHPNSTYIFQPWVNATKEFLPELQSGAHMPITEESLEESELSYQGIVSGQTYKETKLDDESLLAVTKHKGDSEHSIDLNDLESDFYTASEGDYSSITPPSTSTYASQNEYNPSDQLTEISASSLETEKPVYEKSTIVPQYIEDELENLFTFGDKFAQKADVHKSADGSIHMHWYNKEMTPIDSITCGRVNECHPRAKSIFKCVSIPRHVPKVCDGCSSEVNEEQYGRESEHQTEKIEYKMDSKTEEYNTLLEDTDLLEFVENLPDSTTVYFSDGAFSDDFEVSEIGVHPMSTSHYPNLNGMRIDVDGQINEDKAELESEGLTNMPTNQILFILEDPNSLNQDSSNESTDSQVVYSLESFMNPETEIEHMQSNHFIDSESYPEHSSDKLAYTMEDPVTWDNESQTILKLEGLVDKYIDSSLVSNEHE